MSQDRDDIHLTPDQLHDPDRTTRRARLEEKTPKKSYVPGPDCMWRERIGPCAQYPEGGAFYHETCPKNRAELYVAARLIAPEHMPSLSIRYYPVSRGKTAPHWRVYDTFKSELIDGMFQDESSAMFYSDVMNLKALGEIE